MVLRVLRDGAEGLRFDEVVDEVPFMDWIFTPLGGVLGLGAWVSLQVALVVLLDPLPVVSLFAIAIANGGLATMAVFYAMRNGA